MDKAGQRTRERTLRHAAPERVRELLHAYRRRAARDLPPSPSRAQTAADRHRVRPSAG
jgi:hypothetical protein